MKDKLNRDWQPCTLEMEAEYIREYKANTGKDAIITEKGHKPRNGLECGCHVRYRRNNGTMGGCIHCDRNPVFIIPDDVEFRWFAGERYPVRMTPRECGVCGGHIMLYEDAKAFGGKANKCWQCAINKFAGRNQRVRVETFVGRARSNTWAVLRSGAQRSGYFDTCPHDIAGYTLVTVLVARRDALNRREQELQSGIRWVLDHHVPASGTDELKGCTNFANLRLVAQHDNLIKGAKMPEEGFYSEQVFFVNGNAPDVFGSAAEISQRLREQMGITSSDSDADRKHYKKEAAKHFKSALKGREIVFDHVDIPAPREYYETVIQPVWLKLQGDLEKQYAELAGCGDVETLEGYKRFKGELFKTDVMANSHARLIIAKRTMEQYLLRVELMPTDADITAEQLGEVVVMYCHKAMNSHTQYVSGLTHPLLGEGHSMWGLRTDEAGQVWLCSWESGSNEMEQLFKLRDRITLLVADEEEDNAALIDELMQQEEALIDALAQTLNVGEAEEWDGPDVGQEYKSEVCATTSEPEEQSASEYRSNECATTSDENPFVVPEVVRLRDKPIATMTKAELVIAVKQEFDAIEQELLINASRQLYVDGRGSDIPELKQRVAIHKSAGLRWVTVWEQEEGMGRLPEVRHALSVFNRCCRGGMPVMMEPITYAKSYRPTTTKPLSSVFAGKGKTKAETAATQSAAVKALYADARRLIKQVATAYQEQGRMQPQALYWLERDRALMQVTTDEAHQQQLMSNVKQTVEKLMAAL